MSDLWLNFRVAYWHLQIARGFKRVRIGFNRYRWDRGNKYPLLQFH